MSLGARVFVIQIPILLILQCNGKVVVPLWERELARLKPRLFFDNWGEFKQITQKMNDSLIIQHINMEDSSVGSIHFKNVVIMNWLEHIVEEYIIRYEHEQTEQQRKDQKLGARILVDYDLQVNFTVPHLLFSAKYNYSLGDGAQAFGGRGKRKGGSVHCAMDTVAIGMFLHFEIDKKQVWIDNFAMTFPEQSLLFVHPDDPINISEESSKFEPDWKDTISVTTEILLKNYVNNFKTRFKNEDDDENFENLR